MRDEPTIREIFWEESHKLLSGMEEALSRVHREPAAAVDLHRSVHTLAGAAAAAGFMAVSNFCRELQRILEAFSGGPVSGEFIGLFADARAHIAHLIGTGQVGGPVAPGVQTYGRDLLSRLERSTPPGISPRRSVVVPQWRAVS